MTFRIHVDMREVAHCKYCWEPMLYIYDQKKRDICHECLEEIKLENAKEVLKGRI